MHIGSGTRHESVQSVSREDVMNWRSLTAVILMTLVLVMSPACRSEPSTPPVVYSLPQLEYRLLSSFDNVFWSDPDFYPVARPGQEEKNALEQFPIIMENKVEFALYWNFSAFQTKQITPMMRYYSFTGNTRGIQGER